MRIAQIAPLSESVPPKLYGGTERMVSFLVEELVRLGQDVTLFASGDSVTSAKLVPVVPKSIRLSGGNDWWDWVAPEILLLETVRRAARDFDILHFHLRYAHFPVFNGRDVPFLSTMHWCLNIPAWRSVFEAFPELPLVSVSESQRAPVPRQNWVSTIYNGIPQDLLSPRSTTQTYLAFLGRICPEKGVDKAIRIAEACGEKIKIAAKVDKVDEQYFCEVIKQMLNRPHVEFIGEISDEEKSEFLSGAHALLFPIDWPEPFGLAMIEAMACGTPVIAFDRGAVPEVVEDGLTGFIVRDEAGAIKAINNLHSLNRAQVRLQFERRFTARRMAKEYLRVLRGLSRMVGRTCRSSGS